MWRTHQLLEFFLSRLKPSAVAAKRRIWLFWHPDAETFFIHSGRLDEVILGWQVVAYCDEAGGPVIAPALGVPASGAVTTAGANQGTVGSSHVDPQ